MNENRDTITPRQLGMLLWAVMVAPMIRQAPGAVTAAAGRGGWLSALLALPAAALLGQITGRFLAPAGKGQGLGELLCRGLGPIPGRIAAGLWGLWFVFYGGFVLRAGADRFVSAVYPESEPWIFMAVMLALALPAGLGRLRTLGRCAEITVPALGAVFALVFLSCWKKVELVNLFPLSARDAAGTLKGAASLMSALAVGAETGFLAGKSEPGSLTRPFTAAFLGQTLLALLLCVTTVGTFGPAMTERMNYPFFVMIRSIRIPNLMERVEALVAAQWVAADFLLLAALLHAAAGALTLALLGPGREKAPGAVWSCAGGMALCGLLCASTAFELNALGAGTVSAGHALLVYAVLPVCLGIGRLRRKRRGK